MQWLLNNFVCSNVYLVLLAAPQKCFVILGTNKVPHSVIKIKLQQTEQ